MEDESLYILLHLMFVLSSNVCKNCIIIYHTIIELKTALL